MWPMESAHKKPYETLLIGRVKEKESPGKPPVKRSRVDTIPSQFTIMAIPSTTHSQKPYLGGVLLCRSVMFRWLFFIIDPLGHITG